MILKSYTLISQKVPISKDVYLLTRLMGSFDRSSTEVRHTGNLLISYTRYYQILKTVYGKGAKKNKENNIARIAKLPYGQRKALLKVNLCSQSV